MTAVKDSHIIALNDDIASRWGPRVLDLLRAVAAAISAKAQPSASASGGT
jgi:iron complex transport system substrate-binding protein